MKKIKDAYILLNEVNSNIGREMILVFHDNTSIETDETIMLKEYGTCIPDLLIGKTYQI